MSKYPTSEVLEWHDEIYMDSRVNEFQLTFSETPTEVLQELDRFGFQLCISLEDNEVTVSLPAIKAVDNNYSERDLFNYMPIARLFVEEIKYHDLVSSFIHEHGINAKDLSKIILDYCITNCSATPTFGHILNHLYESYSNNQIIAAKNEADLETYLLHGY